MKHVANRKLWRTRGGRLWKLADHLEATAQEVRYANKPADLLFPISRSIDLSVKIREQMYEWLEKEFGLDAKNRGRWPHL